MQQSPNPALPANNSNRIGTPASDNGELCGEFRKITIGYLLYLNDSNQVLDDSTRLALLQIEEVLGGEVVPDPVPVQEVKPITGNFYSVSEYARKKGVNGFNANLAMRVSRACSKFCRKTGIETETRHNIMYYPEFVLNKVFPY